ncbi:MAG: hypothetical protein FVQ85_07765 [Planctomycetes bacterium]|nr:hypothetical protein [Planctomycetota bacterium]
MAKHKNIIKLEIDGPRITADKFTHSVKTFFDLINDVATDVTGKRKAVEWIVSVEKGSIGLCATAEPIDIPAKDVTDIVQAIEKGIQAISKRRKKRPDHFSDNALKKLFILGNITGLGDQGVEHIRIQTNGEPNELSPSSVAYVDDLLQTPTRAYGTIDGYLLALELRGRLNFEIDEILSRKRIKCFFADKIYNDVIKALRQRVSAYGLISYKKGGEPKNIDIEKLTIFPNDDKLPKFRDIIGLLAN